MKKQLPKPIFDDISKAVGHWQFGDKDSMQVIQDVCNVVSEQMIPRPKTFKDRAMVFVKYSLGALIVAIPYYLFSGLLFWIAFQFIHPIPYIQALGIFILLRQIRVVVLQKDPNDFNKPFEKKDERKPN